MEFIYLRHKVGVNMYVCNKGITAENISFLRKLQEYYCDLNNKDGCLCPEDFDIQS